MQSPKMYYSQFINAYSSGALIEGDLDTDTDMDTDLLKTTA